MPERYTAFVSYATRYGRWAGALKDNLEACFEFGGRPDWKVFLDATDLAAGQSWVGSIQAALGTSDHLLLIVAPEALASPRVADEWHSFVATRPDWHDGKLLVLFLVDTPLPQFLEQIHYIDFREADAAKYLRALQELLGRLFRHEDSRDLPIPTDHVKIPSAPDSGLPPSLRRRLVECLAPLLSSAISRSAIAHWLSLGTDLEGHPTPQCAASAAIVMATKTDHPVAAAIRLTATLHERLRGEKPESAAALADLRDELGGLRRQDTNRSLIEIWLQKVAVDHERLTPYFQHQAASRLLEEIYVQLAIRAADPGPLPGISPEELGRSFSLREVLALDQTAHPWITGRWVLLGDPGAGKTTLLRHFAASLARERGAPWIPIFESLPRLARSGRSLLDRISRRMKRAGIRAEGLSTVLDREGQQGRLLLLLDGLDEVPRSLRDEAEELVRDLDFTWPKSPIVVTSRPIGYSSPGRAFKELALLPLDDGRRGEFLTRWFGEQERAALALVHLAAQELAQLAGNPLYLTLMALLFEKGTTPELNQTRLFDQVFELLLEGKHRSGGTPIENPAAVRLALRHLALGMTAANREAEPRSQLEYHLYQVDADVIREALHQVPRWRGGLRRFFDEVSELTGILGPHDGRDADWRFWHRTFREALVAELLADEYRHPDGRKAVLARAREITAKEDLSRWAQPFTLLVGRVDDPDELVAAIVAENRLLGLRALATSQRLRVETVRDVLSLTESWQQRCEVYLQLPKVVEDPQRALAILGHLRKLTRNGNDLFFIDLAAQEAAQALGDERELQEFRLHLYDHIPAPREELFNAIQTARNGEILLWREIKAGRFQMGSLEAEDEENEAERPRHEVVLPRGFLCASVPVTQRQFAAFDPRHVSEANDERLHYETIDHPVVRVTWFEAVAFCRWLETVFPWARGARLPAEEEWEYACRAGTESNYWSGDTEEGLAQVGWYLANADRRTHRVAEKAANPWGLYDVHGNVWEWTLSAWTHSYEGRETGIILPQDHSSPPGTSGAIQPGRVLRGGSYWNDAYEARSACRGFRDPEMAFEYQGFRVIIPS